MPPPGYFYEEDEWYDRPPYPSPRHHRDYLAPTGGFGYGMHRSRSHGHRPIPNVTIYNTLDNETNPRLQASPGHSPRGRASYVGADAAEIAALRMENIALAQSRSRSRSRSRFHHDHHSDWREPSPSYSQMQLKLAEDRLKEAQIQKDLDMKIQLAEQKRAEQLKQEEETKKRILAEEKAAQEKRDREAKESKQRAVEEFERKKAQEDQERKEARQKALDEYERKRKEEEDERKHIIAEYERMKVEEDKRAKAAEAELLRKIKDREDKEKQEYEEFLLKQKEKKAKEKADKKKKEEEVEDQLRKRLSEFGFQNNQIKAMMKPEEAKKLQAGLSPLNPLPVQQPTYVKVHRDHLSVDTLTYYDLPWEYDTNDTNYIIILREMDPKQTDVLFEHTRRLRTRGTTRLLIEDRGRHQKPEYAFVRRKAYSKSPGRRRSSPKRVGLREVLF